MQLKLTLLRPGHPEGHDILVDADPTATVGALARALAERDPNKAVHGPVGQLTLRAQSPAGDQTLDPAVALGDAPLRSGDEIALVAEGGQFVEAAHQRASAATLVVREGPDAGQRFGLRVGANQAGRDRAGDVVLSDPMVSKRHARFNVTDVVEVLDLGSVNGVEVGGQQVQRAILRPGDTVLLGDTLLAVESVRTASGGTRTGPAEPFNRSPYLDPVYLGETFKAPEPPERTPRQRLPLVAMLAPVFFGAVLYLVTKQVATLLFIAFSPVMMLGSWFDERRSAKRELARARVEYAKALDMLDARLSVAQAEEAARRRQEHPATGQVLNAATGRGPMLWARRPDRHGFTELRLGVADLPTRTEVEIPDSRNALPELWADLAEVISRYRLITSVPVVAALPDVGVVGVTGSIDDAGGAARSLLAQIAGLHSPAELVIGTLLSSGTAAAWDWLKWLPHTTSDYNPLEVPLLAAGPTGAPLLVAGLRDLIDQRLEQADRDDNSSRTDPGQRPTMSDGALPAIVLVVDDDVPVERPVLVDLAERGPAAGVFFIWIASRVADLPAAARAFLAHDPATHVALAGFIEGGLAVQPVTAEPLTAPAALAFARNMASLIDAGARTDEAGDLPARVSFLDQMGLELAVVPGAILERWQAGGSLPPAAGSSVPARSKAAPLNAYVGSGPHGALQLDLRAHGPHALVGGTTGSGKSEFLQSWILGLAANHSPTRVTFLFVDYKGGAAFSECVKLPHCVGLVTDLTPHLVQRALASLNAELRNREHILNRRKEKDVLELERKHDPECPPSLVIVVDEFAALVSEVPEFVDGVVNVAQRGRSLGLHLILATQRPAGVIKDNLRANTNLRIALRMADDSDSDDVIGSKIAGDFDPAIPGRAVAKLGPSRLHQFQAAYVGGWTTGEPPPARIDVASFAVAGRKDWPAPARIEDLSAEPGPNDLARLVATVTEASNQAGLEPPRRPWLPELASTYDIGEPRRDSDDLRLLSRTDERLVFGVLDDPANQRQVAVAFEPDRDGHMAVIGTGGAGKSAFLRTLAVAGALSTRGGPCHVYGLDFASRGLGMLSDLPNVGAIVTADDEERVTRLIRTLRATIEERLARYAAVKADSITSYREAAGRPDEARILLLVDGYPTFRNEYELGGRLGLYEVFESIATDGRQAGVHIVISADRVGAVPSTMSSLIQKWLVLRLSGENEYALAGVKSDLFPPGTPPGRGWFDDHEVQVGVFGSPADPDRSGPTNAEQAMAISRLAVLARGRGVLSAPEIGALPEFVELQTLPALVDGRPGFGISDLTLAPISLPDEQVLVVAGPPKSGKTTTMLTVMAAIERVHGERPCIYVGEGRSALLASRSWRAAVIGGTDDVSIEELIAYVKATRPEPSPSSKQRAPSLVLMLDDVPKLSGWGDADLIAELVDAVEVAGGMVLADGETSALSSSYGLIQAVKVARSGILLQPDQYDGENLLKTPLPKIARPDLVPGRGYLVSGGRVEKLQVAVEVRG